MFSGCRSGTAGAAGCCCAAGAAVCCVCVAAGSSSGVRWVATIQLIATM
ncbi:MAG: hypothetical protein V8T86_11475 [Victivallis sp.]